MFYIKLEDDLSLVITERDVLRRGDNLSKKVIYLIPKTVGELDALTAFFYLNYIRADGIADIVMLERMEDMYNETYYQFTFPITCKLTRFPGTVCTWMQIYDGSVSNPMIAKSGECVLQIEDSKNMDDYLSDRLVTALYQYDKKIADGFADANNRIDDNAEAIAANSEAIEVINETLAAHTEALDALSTGKADNLVYDAEANTLQLYANGEPIGEPVIANLHGKLIISMTVDEDGVLTVAYNDGTSESFGRIVGKDGVVFVPHVSENHIITWTIETEATQADIPDPVDLNEKDEWMNIDDPDDPGGGGTPYEWEDL